MSQDLYVSAVDLSMFRAVMGGGDRKMLARILAHRKDDIDSYDWYFARSHPPARPLALVIEEISDGKLLKGTPAWQYEGAVAQIADALGTPLHVEVLFEARAAFCLEVDRLIKDLRKRARIAVTLWPSIDEIMKRGPLLKIPTDRKLRLGSGYLTAVEARQTYAAVRRSGWEHIKPVLRPKLKWPELARDAIEEYVTWMGAAADLGRGLFFHR